jgi:hypothetical protein
MWSVSYQRKDQFFPKLLVTFINTWVKRDSYMILVGKPEGKRPLGRPRRRWEDITMDVKETGWGGMGWIHLA